MKRLICSLAYLASTLLWTIANPYGLWQTVAQSGGQILAVARWLRRGGRLETPPAVSFSLPFRNTWTVANGGVDQETSHSWSLAAQRYAYDFVMTGDDGRTHTGGGDRPQDYHCFGRPILAPAAGEVAALRDDVDDDGRCRSCWIDWRTRDLRGNHVVIKHGEGLYSLSAHLQRGSVAVALGDRVQRGQQIGCCGNSGHATEPHLHFQAQDHPNFFLAVGRPARFTHFAQRPFVDGAPAGEETAVAAGYLSKNHRVRPAEKSAAETMAPVTAVYTGVDLLISLGTFVLSITGIGYILITIVSDLLQLIF